MSPLSSQKLLQLDGFKADNHSNSKNLVTRQACVETNLNNLLSMYAQVVNKVLFFFFGCLKHNSELISV